MKGYECRAKCESCKGNLTHFLEDITEAASDDQMLPYYTVWCVHCRKSYLVQKPARNIAMWTGWVQEYLKHPKEYA